MSTTLKVVHVCTHAVPTTTNTKESITFFKSNSNIDIFKDATIDRIEYIKHNGLLYFPNQHFKLSGTNQIRWTRPDRPEEGEVLTINFYSKKVINQSYEAENCARCSGNGWYVAAASSSDLAIEIATGIDKLLQDYLKILLTDSRYYVSGTSLRSVVGEVVRSDTDVASMISTAIREAETKLKRIQYEMLLDSKEVSDEELLRSVTIDEVTRFDSNDGYYVMLTLINENSYAVSIGVDL